MKTLSLVALISGLVVSSCAFASEYNAVTLGYAQTGVSVFGSKAYATGFNTKYHWENDSGFGVVGSLTYTGKSVSSDFVDARAKLFSLDVGPSWRFSDYVSIYALLGGSYGKLNIDTATDRVRLSRTELSYAVGLEFNPIKNIAIDASYIYTHFYLYGVNIDAGTWTLGLGYRF